MPWWGWVLVGVGVVIAVGVGYVVLLAKMFEEGDR